MRRRGDIFWSIFWIVAVTVWLSASWYFLTW